MRTTRLVATMAMSAALGGTLLAAPPAASAADTARRPPGSCTYEYKGQDCRGYAEWRRNGDEYTIYDQYADGYGTALMYKHYGDSHYYTYWRTSGKGKENFIVPTKENTTVRFYACVTNNGKYIPSTCGRVVKATA